MTEHNKSSPIVGRVNKYSERNVSLRCLFSMGKARAGQGLFVRHYGVNAAEGAQRGALEERSYTEGRVNASCSHSSLPRNNIIFQALFERSSPSKPLDSSHEEWGFKTCQWALIFTTSSLEDHIHSDERKWQVENIPQVKADRCLCWRHLAHEQLIRAGDNSSRVLQSNFNFQKLCR